MIKLIEAKLIPKYYDDTNKLDPQTAEQVNSIRTALIKRGKWLTQEELVDAIHSQDGWEIASITTYGWQAEKQFQDGSVAMMEIHIGNTTNQDPYGQDEAFKIGNIIIEFWGV